MDVDQRILQDLERLAGDPEAAALLECLARHRFDPAHDVGSMLKVCGAARQVQRRLAAKIGPLKTWVTELRMAEAKRRVCDTGDPIQDLCKQVGYPSDRSFRRAFGEAHGESPSAMRQRVQRERARAEVENAVARAEATPADGAAEKPESADDASLHPRALAARRRRHHALALLDPRRAAELRRRLRRRHRDLDSPPGDTAAREQHPVVLTPAGDRVEELAVNAVLGELIDAPEDEARFALRHAVLFGNVPAYRHLQRICFRLIPHRPERALLLAELSVQMIERHRMLMATEGDQWQADAWVFLARVQAHLGHSGDAEQSLAFACAEVGGAENLEPWVEIELRQVEGLLRLRQRRHDAAARALDRAVELGRDLPPADPDRWDAILQRLELASATGDAETGQARADELEELVEGWAAEHAEPADHAEHDEHDETGARLTLWRGFVSYHRGRAGAADGRDCCARRYMLETVNAVAADPASDTDDQLGMLYAFALHQLSRVAWRAGETDSCEKWLRSVVERYHWFEIPVLEAAAEAELAVLCALGGGWDEARRLARAAASFLDDLPFHREAWNAARRLRELAAAAPEDRAPEAELTELLATVRTDLDLVASEITGSQARPAFATRRGSA